MSALERYLPPLSERATRWVRFLAVVAAVAVFIWLCIALREVLTPIVAALALAYILNPVVTWMEQRRVRRGTSVTVGIVTLLLLGALGLFAATLQVIELSSNLPSYFARAETWLRETQPLVLDRVQGLFIAGPAGSATMSATQPAAPVSRPALSPALRNFAQQHGLAIGQSVISHLTQIISNAFYSLSLCVLLPIYTFFFLVHFNQIVYTARDHLPADYRQPVVRVVTTIDRAIANFFRGRLIVCAIIGACTAVGWTLVGVKYGLALGILAGVFNLVPFMVILSLPPAFLFAYLGAMESGANWAVVLALTMGVYLAVQALESFVLSPFVESRASGLHPLTVVIALLIGNAVAGLLGMLLAIPIASTLKSLGSEYLLPEIRRLAGMPEPARVDTAVPYRLKTDAAVAAQPAGPTAAAATAAAGVAAAPAPASLVAQDKP